MIHLGSLYMTPRPPRIPPVSMAGGAQPGVSELEQAMNNYMPFEPQADPLPASGWWVHDSCMTRPPALCLGDMDGVVCIKISLPPLLVPGCQTCPLTVIFLLTLFSLLDVRACGRPLTTNTGGISVRPKM